MEPRRATRVHQHGFPEGRSLAGLAFRYIGASMCTNGSGTNSVKPWFPSADRGSGSGGVPSVSLLDVTVHDGRVVLKPLRCEARMTSSHCCVSILSGQMIARTSSSRISAACRAGCRAGCLQTLQIVSRSRFDVRRPARLERREGVDVHVGTAASPPPGSRRRFRRYIRGGCRPACTPRSLRAPRLRSCGAGSPRATVVRPAAQILGQLALGERAELALEVADVRVVDVAVDDEAHRVPFTACGCGRQPAPRH